MKKPIFFRRLLLCAILCALSATAQGTTGDIQLVALGLSVKWMDCNTDAIGETIINVSALVSGVYIVKCGKQSFKFKKKIEAL